MKKIVVVDDNQMFLETLKNLIEIQKDFNCVTFSNPEDALQHILTEKDVYAVVSDYEMPQMDGLTLVKQFIGKYPTMKIIVMSGHHTNYLKKIVQKSGIDESKVTLLCKSDIINLVVLLNN